ncbi:hypothetical protein C5B42_02765 [Candidatus Cerribacteria bacterium 'Amazon FNV 2010 28 9']|uniref:Uncharacterized protein n=1 Tax=Candidatus Cerribacteria bacterium 'Amazon FNV 2010 28 9' TaxID=2081795 RepID=A0A317JQ65_9BACT|nr:MAG: hypothetical protein C5B42_02765 [Candidatus Cerribacteria bacterium 'Amazon FNV 2010 28 9']
MKASEKSGAFLVGYLAFATEEDSGQISLIEEVTAHQARVAMEQEFLKQRNLFIAEMKKQYSSLSLEAMQKELDKTLEEINEIEEGREPYNDSPFLVARVFQELIAENNTHLADSK